MKEIKDMDNTINDFKKWQEDTLRKAIYWGKKLTEEALKQKTYSDAMNFLDEDLLGIHSSESPLIREVYMLVRTMIGDAKKVVIRKALETEVKHD